MASRGSLLLHAVQLFELDPPLKLVEFGIAGDEDGISAGGQRGSESIRIRDGMGYFKVSGDTTLLSYGHDTIVRRGRVPVNMLDEIECGSGYAWTPPPFAERQWRRRLPLALARQGSPGYFGLSILNCQNHCTGLPCFGVMVIVTL